MQLSREQVEGLLDMQVMAGRMSPEVKEEKMREFDMKVQQMQGGQQMYAQQGGQQMNPQHVEQYGDGYNNPYNDQFGGNNDQSGGYNNPQSISLDNAKYPRVGQAQGILSGPEMIVIFSLAVVLVIQAMKGSGWSVCFLCGLLFTYISARVIVHAIQKRDSFILKYLLFLVCGIGMLVYGIFMRVGSQEAKAAFDSLNDVLAVGSIILVGAGMIVGSFVSKSINKKRFTHKLEAKCIELRSPRFDNTVPIKLSPVYEYYLNGEYKRVMNGVYSNKGYPEVGETREIYINPEIPDDYFEPIMSRSITIFLCILGTFFIAMGLLVIFLAF